MSCKLSDKCDNVFACNVLRPEVELLGCNFYKPKKPMTNEEWLRQASTEDVEKWLSKISKFFHECGKRDVYPKTMYEEDWEWWLKEKHNAD